MKKEIKLRTILLTQREDLPLSEDTCLRAGLNQTYFLLTRTGWNRSHFLRRINDKVANRTVELPSPFCSVMSLAFHDEDQSAHGIRTRDALFEERELKTIDIHFKTYLKTSILSNQANTFTTLLGTYNI